MSPSPVPRTPPALRRSLDRLSRRAHAFHRFAHHPLCVEYARERLQIGRMHFCRGCTLLGAGLAVGGVVGLTLHASLSAAGFALIAGLVSALLSFRLRGPKLLGRALPGALLAFAALQGLRLGPAGWALTLVTVIGFTAAVIRYRRRGPHRGPCETCPDRDRRPACRGFAPILRRERALQRLAGRLIGNTQRL